MPLFTLFLRTLQNLCADAYGIGTAAINQNKHALKLLTFMNF